MNNTEYGVEYIVFDLKVERFKKALNTNVQH